MQICQIIAKREMYKNMKGNGLDPDTLDGVISALEDVRDRWQNQRNCLEYPDLRDAIMYLKQYRDYLNRDTMQALLDVFHQIRGEK